MAGTGPFADEEPDADWTDDFAWTRYRGPQPYPVPEDWVLNVVEADGALFRRYPDVGTDYDTDTGVSDHFEPDYDALSDARGIDASVGVDYADGEEAQKMIIAGETIFRRVGPTTEDLWKTVALALQRYSQGENYQDVCPKTGKPPASIRRQNQIEQRKEDNQQLDQFES